MSNDVICLVHDGKVLRVYVNGVLVSTEAI